MLGRGVGRKKTVCLYLDVELLSKAAELAKARNTSLSRLVEDALRLYVTLFSQLKKEATPPTPPPQPSSQPPHLLNNMWVSMLRAKSR
jgi:hypothetical protein